MVWTYIFRIFLAGVLGLVMGRLSARSGVARTFAIIAMGSALVAVISTEFFKALDNPWVADPGRLSAQVVAAMGFVGTGLIWISGKGEVRGLAGSAGLWVTAVIGMLVGSGLEHVTTFAAFCVVIIYWITRRFSRDRDDEGAH